MISVHCCPFIYDSSHRNLLPHCAHLLSLPNLLHIAQSHPIAHSSLFLQPLSWPEESVALSQLYLSTLPCSGNRSYNVCFFLAAPVVLIILYTLSCILNSLTFSAFLLTICFFLPCTPLLYFFININLH